jgi:hypothetical protein
MATGIAADTGAQMRDLDKTEEMLREGKPVKVEPMPKPVVPPPLPAANLKNEMNREDRLRIADRIVELSDGVLKRKDTDRHIGLKIGSGPYSIAGTVSTHFDRVSFFIRSNDLLKAVEEKFKPELAESTRPSTKDMYRFWGLSLSDIEAHEALFRRIVKETVNVVMDHKGGN